LPAELRHATITKIAAGMSGAGVYKVEADGAAFVLKVSDAPIDAPLREAVARAGVAPRVVHIDPARNAVVTELVVDRSFPAVAASPETRARAIAEVGAVLRRLHAVPIPAGAVPADPRALLGRLLASLADALVPSFVRDAAARALAEPAPPAERAIVLSHNDVNPSNLVWDGERVLLLDWDTAAPNDPMYDVATIAVFLRLDDAGACALLEAYDGAAPPAPPAAFVYWRRLVAALCGSAFLHVARQMGHPGRADATLASTLDLAGLYAQMRSGAVAIATAEGRWLFGLALIKASFAA